MADAADAKFNGTWLMESLTGDCTPWMYYEKMSFVSRQLVWAAGYGAGKITVDQVLHDGVFYTRRTTSTDEYNIFRGRMALDGKKQPVLFSEGAPYAELRNLEFEGSFENGVLKLTFSAPDGSLHSKVEKSISEDGKTMTTGVTFPSGDWGGEAAGECHLTFIHQKQEEARLTIDLVKGWFPGGVLIGDATEEAGKPKLKGVSTSLEGLFPTAQALIGLFEEMNRAGGENRSVAEGSATEFVMTETRPEGGSAVFEFKVDLEACACSVTSSRNGTLLGTWHYKALSDPVRLQCWNTLDKEFYSELSSITEVEKSLDSILAFKAKK